MSRNKSSRLSRVVSLSAAVLLTCIPAASTWAQHTVSLETANTVPSYCQEVGNWCGAATGQMALEGYPGGVDHPFTQTHIWNRIVAHRDDSPAIWATDPDGLRDTLMDLGGDPGVGWYIYANSSAQSLMHTVTYWMTRRHFPTPVLVDPGGSSYGSFQHWILVEGYITDANPETNSTVTLQSIDIVDPWNPPCAANTSGGIRQTVSGSTWFTTYWGVPGNYAASKWHGNYVAVVEPPVKEGTVKAELQIQEGKLISPKEAVRFALKWYGEFGFEKRPAYQDLRGTIPLEPLLVNREKNGYYLVPFGYREGQLSQGALLVNAYTGAFEEIGVFERPITYLDRERAIGLGCSFSCLGEKGRRAETGERLEMASAELIFRTSAQTQSRFMPVWSVDVGDRLVFVTQQERVFVELMPMLPGD